MIYDILNELNQNYKRNFYNKEDIDLLYQHDFTKLVDYIGQNYLIWDKPYNTAFECKSPPKFTFFNGGKIDVIYNILGKHLTTNKKE